MKKLTNPLLVGLLTILIVSCDQNPTELDKPDAAIAESADGGYLLKFENNNMTYEEFTLPSDNQIQSSTNNHNARAEGNSAHTHGDFHAFTSTEISFSGTQNNGGLHGSAEYQQIVTLPFPPYGGLAHFIMETKSVVVEENVAIYGGLITEVLGNGGFPAGTGPYILGRYFYFQVKDNGQADNAPTDQYRGILFSLSNPAPNGGADLPWTFGAFQNVNDPSDKIKVN